MAVTTMLATLTLFLGYYAGRRELRKPSLRNPLVSESERFLFVPDVRPPLASQNRLIKIDSLPEMNDGIPMDSAPFLVWHRNEKSCIVFRNKAYAAFEKTVWLKESPDAPVFQDSQEGPILKKIQKTGKNIRQKITRSVDGQSFTFDVWASSDQSGGAWFFAIDVSEAEREQASNRKSLRHFESALNQLPFALSIFGKNQRMQQFNNCFVRFFQLEEKWLLQHPSLDEMLDHLRYKRMLPEVIDFQSYKRMFSAFFHGSHKPREELLHLPDERSLKIITTPYPDGGLMLIFEDVTEPLKMKRKHSEQASILSALSSHMREGVLLLGVDRRVILTNTVCLDLWGMDRLKVEGQLLTDLLDSCRPYFYYYLYFQAYKNNLVSFILSRTPRKELIYRSDGLMVQFEYIPLANGEHLIKFLDVTEAEKLKGIAYEARKLLNIDRCLFLKRIQNLRKKLHDELMKEGPALQQNMSYVSPAIEYIRNIQKTFWEDRPTVKEKFSLSEIWTELSEFITPMLEEQALSLQGIGIDTESIFANKILVFRFLSRLIGLGLNEASPQSLVTFSARRRKRHLLLCISLRLKPGLRKSWYHPWDLHLTLLKEMAAVSGGRLTVTTGHPSRLRFLCTYPNSQFEHNVLPLRPQTSPPPKNAAFG